MKPDELNPPVNRGDRIQIGTELTDDSIMWGTIQTVLRVNRTGQPIFHPKWAKVEKIADHWRKAENHDT